MGIGRCLMIFFQNFLFERYDTNFRELTKLTKILNALIMMKIPSVSGLLGI